VEVTVAVNVGPLPKEKVLPEATTETCVAVATTETDVVEEVLVASVESPP
jgi:hypothetical protein